LLPERFCTSACGMAVEMPAVGRVLTCHPPTHSAATRAQAMVRGRRLRNRLSNALERHPAPRILFLRSHAKRTTVASCGQSAMPGAPGPDRLHRTDAFRVRELLLNALPPAVVRVAGAAALQLHPTKVLVRDAARL